MALAAARRGHRRPDRRVQLKPENRRGGNEMSATKDLHDAGQSLWLDYITRDAVNDGTIERYIRDLSLTGLTSNPTIFDQALSEGDAYDEQTSELLEAGKRRRGPVLRARAHRPAGSLRPVRRDPRADQRRRRLGLARGLAAARSRHRRDRRRGRAPARRRRSRQPLHQDPGNPGGAARDRGDDRRRRPGQRDAALRRRPVRGAGGGLHARDRAPGRRRARPERRLGGVAVRQPLGRRRRRRGRRSRRAQEPARLGRRDRRLRALPRAARERSLAAARERGRPAAAVSLRLDRDQGPGAAEDQVRARARRAALGRHDARGDAAGARRGGLARLDPPRRRRRQRRAAGRVRARPASTSTSSRCGCRTRAPRSS